MNWSALNPFWTWVSSTWATLLPVGGVDFPSAPTDGQVFGRFYWNDANNTWDFS